MEGRAYPGIAMGKTKCICAEKVDRTTYPPCPECGVRGCNIHQIMGWLADPMSDKPYRADCPVHGVQHEQEDTTPG